MELDANKVNEILIRSINIANRIRLESKIMNLTKGRKEIIDKNIEAIKIINKNIKLISIMNEKILNSVIFELIESELIEQSVNGLISNMHDIFLSANDEVFSAYNHFLGMMELDIEKQFGSKASDYYGAQIKDNDLLIDIIDEDEE